MDSYGISMQEEFSSDVFECFILNKELGDSGLRRDNALDFSIKN